ncbi:polysaccharide biosynthesis C-terminal domain-containing protein [Halorubrum ejinorense]|uniref:Flippase n=1 Tax=Halorubrum ejinorense TaxID=425309 RepID=A0AAV3SU89_9EURY
MNLARASVKIFLAKVVTSLASFVATVVFSQVLGADPLGVYYPFVALLGILSLPIDFGLSRAVAKRISEGKERSQFFGAGILMRFLLLALFSVPVYLYQDLIANYIGANVAGILLIALWLEIGSSFSIAILNGELRVGETALIRMIQPLTWLTVGYTLLSVGYGVEAIIYSHILGRIAVFVAATWKISIYPAVPHWEHLRSLFDFSKFTFVNSIGGIIYSWMDVLIITMFVSLELGVARAEIGAYENAWRVSLLVTFVSRSITQVLFPQISKWHTENKKDKIEQVLSEAFVPALVVVTPALVGVVLLSDEILIYLFGNEFAVAAPALIILVGLRFFEVIDGVYGRVLDAFDRPDLTMIATIFAVTTNLILNISLIYALGITGAAIGTAAAVLVGTVINVYYMTNFITINIPVNKLIWSVISSVIMGIALRLTLIEFGVRSLIDLLLSVTLGAVLYIVVLLVYRPIRESMWELAEPLVPENIISKYTN